MVFRIHRQVSRIRNLVPGIRRKVAGTHKRAAGRCRGCGDGNSSRVSSNSPQFELMVKHTMNGTNTVSTILHHSHPFFIYEVIMKHI